MTDGFRRWLRGQMEKQGWGVTRMAREIGVSHGLVSQWLSGERNPSPKSYTKIARALKTDRDELLVIAGIRDPDLFLDAVDRFHRIADPRASQIDWTDEENVIEIRYALDHIIRIQERRSGKRSTAEFFEPVEANDDDE